MLIRKADGCLTAFSGKHMPIFQILSCRSRSAWRLSNGALAWLVMLLVGFLVNPMLAVSGGRTEVLSVEKAAPAVMALEIVGSEGELRRQMRAKSNVAELQTGTVRFSQAPTGSFGFIAPQFLGMALVTQSPDLVLERMAPTDNAYEIHKLADGNGLLVGFMPKEALPLVVPAERPKTIRISLYSNPSEQAPFIVAVPLVKLMVDRLPIRLDPKKPDGLVMLDMDLQSTVNRKTPVGR